MGDQSRCRASNRSQRYRADSRSTEMQSRLQIMENTADIKDAVDTEDTADVVDTADMEDTADTVDTADIEDTVEA